MQKLKCFQKVFSLIETDFFFGEVYSSAKAACSLLSSSLDRLVAMTSNLDCFIASTTLSSTASLVIRKRAEVPSVTLLRIDFMKPSSIPIWVNEPTSAPSAAPATRPTKGIKKRIPNSRPQKAPLSAPIRVNSLAID